MKKMKIAIIGASIAGATAAILMHRLGFNIQVFEKRGPLAMHNLGAGIAVPPDLVTELKEQDLLASNFPATALKERIFILNNKNEHILTKLPMTALGVNWNILYKQLAARLPLPQVCFHKKIIHIEQNSDFVILTTEKKEKYQFDFVIFADGYHSMGRYFLFPNTTPEFTNYLCWQGNFMTNNQQALAEMDDQAYYFLYQKGILLAYAIPLHSHDNSKAITWFLYELIDQEHPIARDNNAHKNLYQDKVKPEYITYLHHLASTYFPSLGQKIVTKTKKPFTHAIYDTLVPAYVINRVALMGDAGILLRPHIGSGATKAFQEALRLYKLLQNGGNLDLIFSSWGKENHQAASNLFGLSRAFGDFLVVKSPKWDQLDSNTFNEMWDKICFGSNWYQQSSDR